MTRTARTTSHPLLIAALISSQMAAAAETPATSIGTESSNGRERQAQGVGVDKTDLASR